MKVVVLGADGQLGSDIVKALQREGEEVVAATHQDADVCVSAAVQKFLENSRPEAVINCAALHDSDKCEERPDLAMETNAAAVRNLAILCSQLRSKLMTISTDYVFDGTKIEGYVEADAPNPLMWYGRSKLAGEFLAAAYCPRTFVVRSQSLYGLRGPKGKGLNFVDLMLKLASEREEIKVDQCRMSPTWTVPLAENMIALLRTDHFGLYHMSCRGMTTWHEFAERIVELAKKSVRVTPVGNDYYPKKFKRPENTRLINHNLARIGMDRMPDWGTALEGYLKAKGVTA